jgi:hypothetical protein
MAQIRKRGPKQYQARIRLKGQPEVSKTFPSRSDAVEWTRDTEKLLQQNLGDVIRQAQRLTLYQALDKYCTDVTCTKKSWKQETVRLRKWQSHFLSERTLWLNSGGRDTISFCIPAEAQGEIFHRFHIEDLEELAGSYVLVLGELRISQYNKIYCVVESPSHMAIRLT